MTGTGHGKPTRPRTTKQTKKDKLPAREANTLQTLDRGLQALTIISQQEGGLSVADLAVQLGVHRAITYRLVKTLEVHSLLVRGADGQFFLGAGLLMLAARFEPQLRSIAHPLLYELAQETRAASFLSMAQGQECVAIMVAEPEGGVLRVTYRVGSRHPLSLGAAGIAILAGRPEHPGEPDAVREARRNGFSLTRSHLQRGAVGVASPVQGEASGQLGFEASLGVVALGDLDIARATAAVVACARRLAALISSDVRSGTGAYASAA